MEKCPKCQNKKFKEIGGEEFADSYNYPYPDYDEKITDFIYNAYK